MWNILLIPALIFIAFYLNNFVDKNYEEIPRILSPEVGVKVPWDVVVGEDATTLGLPSADGAGRLTIYCSPQGRYGYVELQFSVPFEMQEDTPVSRVVVNGADASWEQGKHNRIFAPDFDAFVKMLGQGADVSVEFPGATRQVLFNPQGITDYTDTLRTACGAPTPQRLSGIDRHARSPHLSKYQYAHGQHVG